MEKNILILLFLFCTSSAFSQRLSFGGKMLVNKLKFSTDEQYFISNSTYNFYQLDNTNFGPWGNLDLEFSAFSELDFQRFSFGIEIVLGGTKLELDFLTPAFSDAPLTTNTVGVKIESGEGRLLFRNRIKLQNKITSPFLEFGYGLNTIFAVSETFDDGFDSDIFASKVESYELLNSVYDLNNFQTVFGGIGFPTLYGARLSFRIMLRLNNKENSFRYTYFQLGAEKVIAQRKFEEKEYIYFGE